MTPSFAALGVLAMFAGAFWIADNPSDPAKYVFGYAGVFLGLGVFFAGVIA